MVVVGVLLERELVQDAADVLLDGALGDPRTAADACVGAALRHEGGNLALAGAEGGQGIVAAIVAAFSRAPPCYHPWERRCAV
ncbi:hypothetical protein ADK57_33070 [Streptomyces sp. MMG1533]|nr:hypothetical protein ADK57_33070 [Streptomyces sp. MMG1533]